MGPLERELARRRGQRKLNAMRRRAGQLRRRVVATAIVGFAVLWTAVFVQMATGHDPALGSGATTGLSATKESPAPHPERRSLEAAVPPPHAEDEDAPAVAEPEVDEAARIEAERREAEIAELEELEAVTTGQS